MTTYREVKARAELLMAAFDEFPRPVRDALNEAEIGIPHQAVAEGLRRGLDPDLVASVIRENARRFVALANRERGIG